MLAPPGSGTAPHDYKFKSRGHPPPGGLGSSAVNTEAGPAVIFHSTIHELSQGWEVSWPRGWLAGCTSFLPCSHISGLCPFCFLPIATGKWGDGPRAWGSRGPFKPMQLEAGAVPSEPPPPQAGAIAEQHSPRLDLHTPFPAAAKRGSPRLRGTAAFSGLSPRTTPSHCPCSARVSVA